jgi:hypothetical protein
LSLLEFSCDLKEVTFETPPIDLQALVDRAHQLLLDGEETEWAPIVSGAASIFIACKRSGLPVPMEFTDLLNSRLAHCSLRYQKLIRRQMMDRPQLVDIEAALGDLQESARFDDQGFQLTAFEGFLRRAVSVACESQDSDLFLAAATLLSQPALGVVRGSTTQVAGLKLKAPDIGSNPGKTASRERLADYAAATLLQSANETLEFSKILLLPSSAVKYLASPDETFCILSYDNANRLCQLLISRDEIQGPKRLEESTWSAKKHSRWSRCFPDRYSWTQEVQYGTIEERPRIEAVNASLRYLSVEIPVGTGNLTFVPESRLFGFPFLITHRPPDYLGCDRTCVSAPSISWLGSVRRTAPPSNQRLEAWLGSPTKSPFDVLKVREGTLPVIRQFGGVVHNTDTPEPLQNANVAILLSHGGRSLARGFGGIPEEFGRFTTEDLSNWLGQCQCVILFVCHAGRSDDRLYSRETFGLVGRLLRLQVRLVIAPSWSLGADIPSIWLPPFLSAFNSGTKAAQAFAEAARTVRDQYAHPCAWGAMQLFGDAEYRFKNS